MICVVLRRPRVLRPATERATGAPWLPAWPVDSGTGWSKAARRRARAGSLTGAACRTKLAAMSTHWGTVSSSPLLE
eukprot:358050-Chlamydomonas_euryale.AAC.2